MAALLVSLGCSTSRAAIDAELNTSNFVSGQASELSVDGVITAGGPSTGITACGLVLRYDTAQVTVSGLRAGTGWSLEASNQTTTDGGWVKAVLTNMSGNGAGQTTTGPILYFTVTPANSGVDPAPCGTLRFAGAESDLADQGFEQVYPSDPCAGRMAPLGSQAQSTTAAPLLDETETTIVDTGGIQADNLLGCAQEFPAAIRALKIAAGLMSANLSGNSNYKVPETGEFVFLPLTQQDQATLEMVDPGLLVLPHYRNITITDVVMILRERYTGPPNAVWAADFLGNALEECGGAANAVGMPAIAQLDGFEAPEAIVPMGTINGQNYYPTWRYATGPQTFHNPNAVYVFTDTTSHGAYAPYLQWPKQLSDAPAGVAVADVEGNGHPQVIASCFQDQEGNGLTNLYSRLYVWNHNGSAVTDGNQNVLFPTTTDPTNTSARGYGHAIAPPVAYNVNNDENGVLEVVFSTQGQTNNELGGEFGGAVQFLEPDGSLLYETIPSDTVATPWRVGTAKNQAEFITPPVMARSTGGAPRFVVAGAYSGDVYAWRPDSTPNPGVPKAGFPVQTDTITVKDQDGNPESKGRAIVAPLVSGDVNGDSHAEIIAGCGRSLHYYSEVKFGIDPRAPDYRKGTRYNDGFVYCWDDAGVLQWRYPKDLQADWNGNINGHPGMDAGIALGRLRGPNTTPCIVTVRADGYVVALKGDVASNSTDAQRELWHYQIPVSPLHLYYRGFVAAPLIADVNNDGYQDVIVGTTHGEIYILNGNPPTTAGQAILGTPYHTYLGPDSVWWDHYTTPWTFIPEQQFEEVRGLALGPLRGDSPTHAILVVSSGRAGVTSPNQVGGHVIYFDLGANSWLDGRHDWPQFQQNAQRTGSYPD